MKTKCIFAHFGIPSSGNNHAKIEDNVSGYCDCVCERERKLRREMRMMIKKKVP